MSNDNMIAVLLPDEDGNVWTVHYMTKEDAEKSLETTINNGSDLVISKQILKANADVVQDLQIDVSGYCQRKLEERYSDHSLPCMGVLFLFFMFGAFLLGRATS